MAEIADFFCRERALFGAEFEELCVAEPLEDLSEAGEVLFPCGGKDDDVVQVEEAGFPVAGERSGSIAEAKRDLIKFK